VQAEKLKERTLKKKESIKNLDKWRKQRKQNNYAEEGAKAPEGFEDGFRSKDSPKGRKRSTQETRQKREFKNEKFGFGGRKRVSVHASFPPVSIPFVLSFVQYRPHPA
jgi:rRNA-processing protein EBP2